MRRRKGTASNRVWPRPGAWRARAWLIAGALAWTGANAVQAEPMTANGLQFSDERGHFRILSLSGSGARDDPFVLVEEILGNRPAVVVIRGLAGEAGRMATMSSFTGFALTKVVINRTNRTWSGFDHELREQLNKPSDYMDGLSFDQPRIGPRPFYSDRFSLAHEVHEPFDTLRYREGNVLPGQSVRFDMFITDPTPRNEFFLIQQPYWPIAWLE
jgi:hypothetical protein